MKIIFCIINGNTDIVNNNSHKQKQESAQQIIKYLFCFKKEQCLKNQCMQIFWKCAFTLPYRHDFDL